MPLLSSGSDPVEARAAKSLKRKEIITMPRQKTNQEGKGIIDKRERVSKNYK